MKSHNVKNFTRIGDTKVSAKEITWERVNKSTTYNKRSDNVTVRVKTKKNGAQTFTLSLGKDLLDTLDWKAGDYLEPKRSPFHPNLIRFERTDDHNDGYTLSGSTVTTRLTVSMVIKWDGRYEDDRSKDLLFEIDEKGITVDLTDLMVKGRR